MSAQISRGVPEKWDEADQAAFQQALDDAMSPELATLRVQLAAAEKRAEEAERVCHAYWDWEYGDADHPATGMLVAWAKPFGLEATRGDPGADYDPYERLASRIAALEEGLRDIFAEYVSVMKSEFDTSRKPWSPESADDKVALRVLRLLGEGA